MAPGVMLGDQGPVSRRYCSIGLPLDGDTSRHHNRTKLSKATKAVASDNSIR